MDSNAVKFVFKTGPGGSIAWPCTISVPLDGGGRQDQVITARFRLLSVGQIKQLTEDGGDVALLNEAVIGFDDLRDAEGRLVDDAAAKSALLALPYCIVGFVAGYFDMIGRRLPKN